jgi:RNase P subunit RPR2
MDSEYSDTISNCSTVSHLYLPITIDKKYETKEQIRKIKNINVEIMKLKREFKREIKKFIPSMCYHPLRVFLNKNGEKEKEIRRKRLYCSFCNSKFVIR